MNATERRLRLIEVLSVRRRDTMVNLAFEFGVSSKTIQRDLIEINDMIPIRCRPGRYEGGVYVMDSFSTQKIYMNQQELRLLIKVRDFIEKHEDGTFSNDERMLIEHMIKKYTKPAM